MTKTKLKYALDVLLLVAFLLSAVTGIILWLGGSSGGYQGGSNPAFQTTLLGIARETWKDLHTLSSLVMVAGVGLHLVLQWKWIVCMTGRFLSRPASRRKSQETQSATCTVQK